jgi:branched-chain amino acid aminotransferase
MASCTWPGPFSLMLTAWLGRMAAQPLLAVGCLPLRRDDVISNIKERAIRMKVYLDGAILNEGEALIPAGDRGVLFGDGIFETVRAYDGKPFRMDRHLDRLSAGCRELRLTGVPSDEVIAAAVAELYRLNVVSGDAYVRITLTGGIFDGNRTLQRPGPPHVYIVVKPFEGYPQEWYERGMRVVVSGIRRSEGSPLSRIKSNNYLANLMAKQEARDRGGDDAVLLNSSGYLTEGTSSNLFLVWRGKVATPGVECGLLPGVTREAVLELCEEYGIACETGLLALDELLQADEAFFTVSTGEIVPIAEVEGTSIGFKCPGPITVRLADAYKQLVKKELAF